MGTRVRLAVICLAAISTTMTGALATAAARPSNAIRARSGAAGSYHYRHYAARRNGARCTNLSLNSISNHGAILGTVYCASTSHGFIRRGGKQINFAVRGHGVDTEPAGISDHGSAVIDSQVGYHGRYTSWLRKPHGALKKIDNPKAGGYGTVAEGINKRGVIAGYYFVGKTTHTRGYVERKGHFRTYRLPRRVHATSSTITDIDNAGDTCGSYTTKNGVLHGFVVMAGKFRTIRAPGAGHGRGEGSYVSAVTPRGTYAGVVIFAKPPNNNHRFRPYQRGFVHRHGRFATLAVPWSWGDNTEINAMNNAGRIVGDYIFREGNAWLREGFVANP
jgi:hypothetical protein